MNLSNQLENIFSFENGLYAVGSLLLAYSVLYFEQNSLFMLSPVVKAGSLILIFKILFIAGLKVKSRFLRLGVFGSASFTYLMFLSYVSGFLGRSSIYTLLLLGLSAAGFLAFGKIYESGFELENKNIILVVLAVFLVAIIGADVTGVKTRYSLNLNNNATLGNGEVELGSIVFQNEFFLPREPEDVRFKTCYLTENGVEERPVNLEPPRLIGGKDVSTVDLSFYYRTDSDGSISKTLNITRLESCEDVGENEIGITEEDENLYRLY